MFTFELLAGISVLAIGLEPALPVVVISMALMGAALASSTVIWQSTLQRHVPEHMLGRVSSIDLLGNSLINPIAPIAAAALVAAMGPAAAFAVAGVYAVTLASIARGDEVVFVLTAYGEASARSRLFVASASASAAPRRLLERAGQMHVR